jgi:hypothetical protein
MSRCKFSNFNSASPIVTYSSHKLVFQLERPSNSHYENNSYQTSEFNYFECLKPASYRLGNCVKKLVQAFILVQMLQNESCCTQILMQLKPLLDV